MTTDEQRIDVDGDVDLVPEDDRIIGVAFKWSLAVLAIVAAAILGVFFLRTPTGRSEVIVERAPVAPPSALAKPAEPTPELPFTDVTRSAGIDFERTNGAVGEKLLPETMGGGAAFFDADADGDQDLVLIGGRRWDEANDRSAPSSLALYLNRGDGTFVDATAGSGLEVSLYGMGVAAGDIDNDGMVDLYVTTLGPNHLFRNLGRGRFADVTDRAGVAGDESAWSSSAGFADLDGDGDLDLFVANYIEWSEELDLALHFTLNGTDRAYGPPNQYPGADCVLYFNRGDGTFTDVSESAGITVDNPSTGAPAAKALALTFADVDSDGTLDIFVANDTVDNFLFLNQGDGTFVEAGRTWGVATDNNGSATGAMGVDVARHRDDDRLAFAVGNFANEASSLFVQGVRAGTFTDLANLEGIGSQSRLRLSFGLVFLDADLDGRLDLLQANGHLETEINDVQPSQSYRQPAQLFWNSGTRRRPFALLDDSVVGDLATPIVGRAATYADIDGDGDLDALLTQPSGPPLVLRNRQELGHHWLRVRLIGGDGVNRDAIGSWIEATVGDRHMSRQVMPTRSYLSQVELPVTFGLGPAEAVDRLVVHWPDGEAQDVAVAGVDTTLVIHR